MQLRTTSSSNASIHGEDLWIEPDVGVVMLPARQPMRSNIDLASAVESDKKNFCLLIHGPKVLNSAAQEHKATAQVIYVGLSYLAISFD